MQTITFYSYKGGVGRTLALANMARFLASFGQRVFAMDLDLEAPGLPYKLAPTAASPPKELAGGVVDVLHALISGEVAPASLDAHVQCVEVASAAGGSIHLMPAGNARSGLYWRKLAQVSWHDLFYAEGARGIPFFLELKERIKAEFAPDYLLIDARAGITELGGVATTLLPEQVICLLANSRESIEGARAVLRSIKRTPRLPGQEPVAIVPVIARVAVTADTRAEGALVERARAFLNEPADDLADTLEIPEVFVLHAEPDLEVAEALRVGSGEGPQDSPLLRGYLRLFSRMFPDVIEPRLSAFVRSVMQGAMDDPDGAERALEAHAAAFPHPQSYRALLQFYRLRRAAPERILPVAQRYWELSRRSDDPLLWEMIASHPGTGS